MKSTVKVFAKVVMAAVVGCAAVQPALAGMQDEIQVYTDEINEPGEYALEWHVNATPKGITTPSYPGEITNHHGLRLTPEFSRGLSKTTEVGLYLPTVYSPQGHYEAAGLKVRFKWLPVQTQDTGGFFAGVNVELGQVRQRFSESARSVELRHILGWRSTHWLMVFNPILGFDASRGISQTPSLEIATKVNRKIHDKTWLGWERYNDRGPIHNALPSSQQGKVNYLVVDHEMQGFDLNFGVGRGSTAASDAWTVKAIIGYPLSL